MKIVIAGGTGHLGRLLERAFTARGDEVVILGRSGGVRWDGRSLGAWAAHIDGADVVVNLAGRSVNCRYTRANLAEMLSSRVDSTRVIGEAIASAARPPRVWLQMSTATIYAHRFDAPNDEEHGLIGGDEPDVPAYWRNSVEIAKAWEAELFAAPTPKTRKLALRTAMVMSSEQGSVFTVLRRLARLGLGGPAAGGAQYVSWIHEHDFVRAIFFLIDHEELEGAVNLAAPHPLPWSQLMKTLREEVGAPFGLPATKWMLEVGAFLLRTDTELLLKSRRVIPTRLLEAGFNFDLPRWPEAAQQLNRAEAEGVSTHAGPPR